MKRILICNLFFLFSGFFMPLHSQDWRGGNYHCRWGDSVLSTLNLREQIGQMMMIAAWSNKGNDHIQDVETLIRKYNIGGICFFQGHPLKQVYQTNYYQQISKTPLLIAIDGEWGPAMRLNNIARLPYQMTLGATGNADLVYQTGKIIGKQCKRLGIHINFAPVVDVNTNPNNPIIGFRSFGETAGTVAGLGNMITKGMQDAGIIACAKHFPGHGDSEADSHLELPRIEADKTRIESVELQPFRQLFHDGVQSAMVAHLEIPSLDSVPHRPSSLSPMVVNELLKKQMGFKGLVITDALNMKGVASLYGPGFAELAAVEAGNDIVLFPENVPKAIDLIENKVKKGLIDSTDITERVRKILYFKYQAGLHRSALVSTENLMNELLSDEAGQIQLQTAEQAVTLVSDKHNWIPVLEGHRGKTAYWSIGKTGNYVFGSTLQKHGQIKKFHTDRDSDYETFGKMSDSLARHFDNVIVGIHDQNLWGKKSIFLPQQVVQNIYALNEKARVVVVIFGNVYILHNLPNLPCLIAAWQDDSAYQQTAADIIFGKKPATGKLPATAGRGYTPGMGISTKEMMEDPLPVSSPLKEGMKSDFSAALSNYLDKAVLEGNMPGGELMVLKNGKAIYQKAYGFFTYDKTREVKSTDLYDLASVTKIAATTLAVMKLHEQNKVILDAHIHMYLPEMKGTNKEKITVRQLLTHQAGLQAFIPFYLEAAKYPGLFSSNFDISHRIQISDSIWMRQTFKDTLWKMIVKSPLKNKGEYLYSDLSMIILGRMVERITGETLDEYVDNTFYRPMNLKRLGFKPAVKFETDVIAPTCVDGYFRNQTVQGFVHDPSAAMWGGVAGNAGLFSNAEDLAKLMQMLLNGGKWKNQEFLKQATISEFTARQKNTYRGAGFDKPNDEVGNKANVSDLIPKSAFGHSGFTGIWAWGDPENQMVFVFLSNRTYPDENNRKIITNNIRTGAIEIVYKALR